MKISELPIKTIQCVQANHSILNRCIQLFLHNIYDSNIYR